MRTLIRQIMNDRTPVYEVLGGITVVLSGIAFVVIAWKVF